MNSLARRALRAVGFGYSVFLAAILPAFAAEAPAQHWIGTWATAPVSEVTAKDTTPLAGSTVRQVVHVSIGGSRIRIRISNAFGPSALSLNGVHVAVAAPGGAINPETDQAVLFDGQASATIPAGAEFLSDPLDFSLETRSDLAVSIHLKDVPATLTLHGGARATSYLKVGDALSAPTMPSDATTFTRWYFLRGIDVVAPAAGAAVAILGDSFTDGYGCTTDQNNRWTDVFARRLHENRETAEVAVLNLGIGGNRLLRDGLGPNALARLDRDVLAQAGTRWLIVLEGINDIGTRLEAKKRGAAYASARDIIVAYQQIIARAKTHRLRIIGATITPYAGAGFYWSEDGEADRQAVNQWIRESRAFDAVIDFDAALRDPGNPAHLAKDYDSGDHLHPSIAGYRQMAEIVDLSLFSRN